MLHVWPYNRESGITETHTQTDDVKTTTPSADAGCKYIHANLVSSFFLQQLAAIFITRQVIGNIKEALIPYVIEKLKLFKIGYDMTGNFYKHYPFSFMTAYKPHRTKTCLKALILNRQSQIVKTVFQVITDTRKLASLRNGK